MNLIALDNVNYSYPGQSEWGLRALSLKIERGEFVALVGDAGQGKSSLLRLMSGILSEAYGGEGGGSAQFIDGDLFAPLGREQRLETAFLTENPENSRLFRSVEREFRFGLENCGLEGRELQDKVFKSAELFNLSTLLERQTDKISTGELSRVMLAATLATNPAIVLLDQPVASLSEEHRKHCLGVLSDLNRDSQLTVVISGLSAQEIRAHASRVVKMSDGKIGFDGTVTDFFAQAEMESEQISRSSREVQPRPICRVSNLEFGYDNSKFTLSIPRLELNFGSIVAVTGSNGSGKTTLLRLLCSSLTPNEGSVDRPERAFYLPSDPTRTLACVTVAEELELGLSSDKFVADDDFTAEVVEILGLQSLLCRHPRDLSFFQRYSVALASLAVLKPGMLLLDEPTRGAGRAGRGSLKELFHLLCSEFGTTVVCATNDPDFVANCTDQEIHLIQGELAAKGTRSQ